MASAIDILINATDKASAKIKKIGSNIQGMSERAERASLVTNAGLLALAGGLGAVMYAGINMNSTMETSEARWTTLLKSSEKAEKQMAWMKQFAKVTPFNYKGIDQTATSLMGMGLGIKDVQKWLPALGDASAVLGGGTETVNGLGMAIGQMNAKGKVSAEEMQQLAERGVNGWQMIADGLGLTQAEVRKLSEDGKLLAKDALPLIQAGMEKTFGGGTANLMKSTTGQAMLAQENFATLAGTLTNGAFDWFGANVLPLINSGLESLTTLFEGGLMEGFKNLWDSSGSAKVSLLALSGIITGVLIASMFAIAPAIASAAIAFAPFLLIGLAIAGLAFLIMKNWDTLSAKFAPTIETLKTIMSGLKEAFRVTFSLMLAGMEPVMKAMKSAFTSLAPILEMVGVVLGGLLLVALATFNGIVSAIAPLLTAFFNLVDFVALTVQFFVKLLTGDMAGASDLWIQMTEKSIEFFKNLWLGVQGFFAGFFDTFVKVFESFGIDIIVFFTDMWSSITQSVENGINTVITFFTTLPAKVMTVIDTWLLSMSTAFTNMMTNIGIAVSAGVSNIINFFKALPMNIVNILIYMVGFIIGLVIGLFLGLVNATKIGIESMIEFWRNFPTMVVTFISNLANGVMSWFTNMMESSKSTTSNGLESIKTFFSQLPSKVISFITTLATNLVNNFNTMMSNAKDAVSKGIENVIKFFQELPSKVMSFITSLGSQLESGFNNMMEDGKSAVSTGIENIVTAITNFGTTFLDAGKGLLDSFVTGIKSGIDKAVGAVSDGMEAVRKFLPFSPAEKGALSDLDKSGESFFPTWYKGALKGVSPMTRAIGGAMESMNRELTREAGGVALESFSGGRNQIVITHEHKHSGSVDVIGDNSSETVKMTADSVKTKTELEFDWNNLRQTIRKR